MQGSKGTSGSLHRHRPVTRHAIRQRAGVPYEVERRICAECARVLDERPVRRAAA
jgi:NMD protein affecting ribosome stability and mRNA decay